MARSKVTTVPTEELRLLREIAARSSEYILAASDPEFAEMNGGKDAVFDRLVEAEDEYCDYHFGQSGYVGRE